jgi:putative sigma-54 modulation protein
VDGGVGGAVFHGEERGEDVFKAIDKVTAVITRQLERHKGKLYDKGRGNSLARGKYNDKDRPAEPTKIVKKKRFALDPMSIDEAIERMEELEHSFFLFLDDTDEAVKLLYRRNDNDYGLIVPELP